MSRRRLLIVIVDDQEDYRKRLARRLTDKTMKCETLAPPSTPTADEILSKRPDAVLVDYELTQRPRGSASPPAAYFGSLLIAAIRERLPTTPLILLTRKTLASRGDFLDRAMDLDEAFDDLLYKDDVKPARLRAELSSLVAGYQILARSSGAWHDVLAAMGAPEYARDELRRFGAPGARLKGEGDGSKKAARRDGRKAAAPRPESFRPGSIARWVRRVVLAFPGPLVDDLRAATELGIALKSFTRPNVLQWFQPAQYSGVFATEHRRWWRGALQARAEAYSRADGASSGDGPPSFEQAWNATHPAERLKHARCCVCGLPTNEAVCEVLREPVMQRCSLPYYPDSRPSAFDVARISFTAIRNTQVNDESFASNVLRLVREVEAGREP